ncbi:MAG: mannose-1-phosphate guanylyltransferase/mannose-6-phosphate isomerase [Gammaproteobacteria bacterium]|nr:mannose-1-phosphate guanylyltransferase/mannose-6-phosphate isomerase [Gammaproteobacteria bacterium]MYB37599.1 mannose-1-phosphate guanylyltransferase/mannose-6-phosphate isomerase [Gammaproteobacteria bacterium]
MAPALIPVILAGGAGVRLWPLSRVAHPKPFLRLLGDRTLFRQALDRVRALGRAGEETEPPWIVCNELHRFLVGQECGDADIVPGPILLEPEPRNTAPAVALAALHAIRGGEDPLLLVLPADHHIGDEDAFADAVHKALPRASTGGLVTFGVTPTAAQTGYGYIRARGSAAGQRESTGPLAVAEFVEKPSRQEAERMLAEGTYHWNSGMFLFRASAFLDELGRHQPALTRVCREAMRVPGKDAYRHRAGGPEVHFLRPGAAFAQAPAISIDHGVMEHTDRAWVVPVDCGWSDVGAWPALRELAADASGNVLGGDVVALEAKDSVVLAESRLVAVLGIDNAVVVETPDAVLVADGSGVERVRELVQTLKKDGREETDSANRVVRPWGTYERLAAGPRHQVKRIVVRPGAALSLQTHRQRSEHWVVVQGSVEVTRGEDRIRLQENESTYIPAGALHRLSNPGSEAAELIEVQVGDYLGEDDIERFADNYGRADEPNRDSSVGA